MLSGSYLHVIKLAIVIQSLLLLRWIWILVIYKGKGKTHISKKYTNLKLQDILFDAQRYFLKLFKNPQKTKISSESLGRKNDYSRISTFIFSLKMSR